MKEELELHLHQKILPFWMNLIDEQYGGFYSHVSAKSLEVQKTVDKGLVQHARLLWTFSALENHYKNGKYLLYMDQAYRYLMNYFYDENKKGWIWMTTFDGRPSDTRKITYGLAFLIYGLTEYYKVTKDARALEKALETFHLIEEKALQDCGFYTEEFDERWHKLTPVALADDLKNVEYTLNTSIHILEAYVNLYEVTENQEVYRSIFNLIHLFKRKIYSTKEHSLIPYFNKEEEPINLIHSFGHNIEFAWLLEDAMFKLKLQDDSLSQIIQQLIEEVYFQGFSGSYVYNSFNSHIDKTMVWWAQSESMVGFSIYKGNLELRPITEILWKNIINSLVDPRDGSEWYWAKNEDGSYDYGRGIAELWKTPYHNVRSILKLIEGGNVL